MTIGYLVNHIKWILAYFGYEKSQQIAGLAAEALFASAEKHGTTEVSVSDPSVVPVVLVAAAAAGTCLPQDSLPSSKT